MDETQSQVSNSTPDIDSWMYDPANYRLMKHFGIDSTNAFYYQEKIKNIRNWAEARTKSQDVADWLQAIKGVQREMGADPNVDPINEINRYARLDADEQYIQKEKALYGDKTFIPSQKKKAQPSSTKNLISNEVNKTMGKVQKDIQKQVQQQVRGIVQKAIKEAF